MDITVTCRCGRELTAPEESRGLRGECPSCGRKFIVGEELLETARKPEVRREIVPQREFIPARAPSRMRHHLYWLMLIALAPLAWLTFYPTRVTFFDRLDETMKVHPEVQPAMRKLFEDKPVVRDADILLLMPGHRLVGAVLPFDTYRHWLAAGAAALMFGLVMLPMFGPRVTKWWRLASVALFTGTLGILFLIAVQYVADWTQGYMMYGGGLVAVAFWLAKLIGFSYRAALGDTGFVLSFFGFIVGVGLCEEICKALPLYFLWTEGQMVRRPTWRGLCLWGMASGAGFGISEGIHYSSHYYNGVAGSSMYLVRFVSCVALHAVWTAAFAVGTFLHSRYTDNISDDRRRLRHAMLVVLAPSVVLHGLYDTLLKKEKDVGALIVAMLSFAWLAIQIERARRTDPIPDAETGRLASSLL